MADPSGNRKLAKSSQGGVALGTIRQPPRSWPLLKGTVAGTAGG